LFICRNALVEVSLEVWRKHRRTALLWRGGVCLWWHVCPKIKSQEAEQYNLKQQDYSEWSKAVNSQGGFEHWQTGLKAKDKPFIGEVEIKW